METVTGYGNSEIQNKFDKTIDKYLAFLQDIKRTSENTLISYKRDLKKLKDYFVNLGIDDPKKVSSTYLNAYILYLEKEGSAPATISRYVASIKSYFQYLFQSHIIEENPAMLLKAPFVEKKQPEVLTEEEVAKIMEQPKGNSLKEIRDKAMLELLYATGMRVSELINLKLDDVNVNLGYVTCNNGKKERIIPVGKMAKDAVSKYLSFARYELLAGKESDYLFLNCSGGAMSRQGFWKIIKKYGEQAGISTEITPQTIRHSFGYHLVDNGANLYAVQEMMGHSTVYTTQMYKNVKHKGISEEYAKAHPRS